MPDFSIEARGLDDVMNRIRMLPDETQADIITDVAPYTLDVLATKQPPYKHVTRGEAYGDMGYGPGWFSVAQRKKVMAMIRSGEIQIPYNRTGQLAKSWGILSKGDGQVVITSSDPAAPFVQGSAGGARVQSRHEEMVGWKTIGDIIKGELSFRSSRFRNVVMDAYQKAIRKLNLG